MSQLVNVEVNSGNRNRKVVLVSNYAKMICGRHAALRECIMYKRLNYARTSDTRSNAKVDVCVLLVVLRGCQSSKNLRILFPRIVLLLNET